MIEAEFPRLSAVNVCEPATVSVTGLPLKSDSVDTVLDGSPYGRSASIGPPHVPA